MITELKRSRAIKPFEKLLVAVRFYCRKQHYWSLQANVIWNLLTYGIRKFRDNWYKGDGLYGMGPDFHMDYYNSYVILPC